MKIMKESIKKVQKNFKLLFRKKNREELHRNNK
jgi:hypothetical protein